MKQHWLVAPVDIKRDERKPIVVTRQPNRPPAQGGEELVENLLNEAQGGRGFGLQQDAVRVARNIARARREDIDAWGNPVGTEYGFIMHSDTKKEVEVAFTSKELAFEYAADQAAKKPSVQYGVFECVGVFETTIPTVIHKKFSSSGELILEAAE